MSDIADGYAPPYGDTMRAPRKDANHAAIKAGFENLGCSVLDLAAVGCGCPDLLVARCGNMRLVEIKDGAKSPSQRRLTEQQARFHAHWNGNISIATGLEDVARIVNSL